MFPYLSGLSYACRLYVDGGWPAVAAYDDLPQTTAEILFPEAAGEAPKTHRCDVARWWMDASSA